MKTHSFMLTCAAAVLSTPILLSTSAQAQTESSTDSSLSETQEQAPSPVHTQTQPQLQKVVVTASRVETPLREVGASVSSIEREEIQLRGYPTIAQLLRTQAGISVSNSGGAGKQSVLRIRGEEGFRTLMMIDGVDVSDPTGPQVAPLVENFTTGDDVERVEILRGPQGFIYGADAGGVVQIISRTVEQGKEGQLTYEGGRYGSQKLHGFIAAGDEKWDAFFSASDWRTDGFNSLIEDIAGDADGYDNTTLHAKFGWKPTEHLRAQLVVRDIDAHNQYDRCYNNDFEKVYDCDGTYAQTTAKLSLDHSTETLNHHVAFAHTSIKRADFAESHLSFGTEGSLKKLEYVLDAVVAPWMTLVAGADTEMERIHQVNEDDLSRYQLGLFTEAQLAFDDRFFFTGGFRYDENEDFGEHISARITSAYLMPAGEQGLLKFRASAGNGFRAPSLYEVTYNLNADEFDFPKLQEEQSSGYDIGVEYWRESGLNAQITWFEQSIKDEIIFDPIAWTGYLQAEGRSHSRGAELELSIPVTRLAKLETSFTRNLTRTADDTPRIRRPKNMANVSLYVYPLENFTVLLHQRWESGALDASSAGVIPEKIPAFHVMDISANYKISSDWEVFVRVENAGNKRYQEIPGYHASARAAYGGVRFSF